MRAEIGEWITASVHYLAMAFIVFGGFLSWRWRWVRWPHAAIIGWAVLSLLAPVTCPLTWLENYFRHLQGHGDLAGGFIDTYITGVLYPADTESVILVFAMVVVLVSWGGAYLRWRHERRTLVDDARIG